MSDARARPKTVAQYIQATPTAARARLKEMRSCILAAAPGATESLKWGMPAVSHKRILVTYAAFAHHIGLYPTPSAVAAFATQLSKFKTAKGSIQFPLDKPLPVALIRKITAFRVRESVGKDEKWRS
jgi:uncharacterized protein YdhG (YjbR/CyaY superfamily)